MLSVLVAVAFYPDDKGNKLRYYTHVRNKYYMKYGINVTVLNFATDHDYHVDGVKVISLNSYEQSLQHYDLLVCHAPNIRNHYRFLKKHQKDFPKYVFFFHGQEVMHLNKYYPKPFSFKKKGFGKMCMQDAYDDFKLTIWHTFFLKNREKSNFVFVSAWLRDVFFHELHIKPNVLNGRVHIISNSVGDVFEKNSYNTDNDIKKYDFITIRNHFDESTYAVDLLVKVASANPEYKFCLIGNGRFFEYNERPKNLLWIAKESSHSEILRYLDQSRCGLMLTRHDTQGVMSSEMATYGIPLITSDIAICREVFEGFPNVELVNNNSINLSRTFEELRQNLPYAKNQTYLFENTVLKEINLLRALVED